MPPALLPDMLAQELMRFGIENADVKRVPLDLDLLSDPAAGRCAVAELSQCNNLLFLFFAQDITHGRRD